jgi:drug/metabolite transporter (DMT)-like permease
MNTQTETMSVLVGRRRASSLSPALLGAALGVFAALLWGANQAAARAGIQAGLSAFDIAVLRFGTAGLLLLPWLLRRGLRDAAGVGWSRALIIAVLIGPLFFLLNVGGYAFAPLAHGAVVLPAAFTIASMALAAWVLGERPSGARLFGAGIVFAGLIAIVGRSLATADAQTPLGDAMFAIAGSMWATATVLVQRWKITPMQTVSLVATISAAVLLPLWWIGLDHSRIATASWQVLALQVGVQGIAAGIFAVLAFTRAVVLLGAARAAVFPALVPAFAILLGIPLTGEWPSALQWLGLGLVSIGLIVAVVGSRQGERGVALNANLLNR